MNQNKKHIISRLKTFFENETSRYHIEMVFLYGSWVGGFPHDGSDIDLAILFHQEVDNQDRISRLVTDISYTLGEELDREVNVISVSDEFTHPMLYYNAIVLGILIFGKDFNKYINLRNNAIFQMEDFSIFGLKWQLEVAKDNLEGLKYA